MSDCCDVCDWADEQEALEDAVDIHVENSVKDVKLINIAKIDSDAIILLPKPKTISGKDKADGAVEVLKDETFRVGNVKEALGLAHQESSQ